MKTAVKLRRSKTGGDSARSEIRVYDGKTLLGRLSPIAVKWEGFTATASDLYIGVLTDGCPERCEIEVNGLFGKGPVTDLTSRYVRKGDTLLIRTLILTVDRW